MLHALGADDRILALYKRGLDGHFRQYTEAKTSEVELGREGMYYQEFHRCFDWMHHGEAWSPIVLQGLSDPRDHKLEHRMRWSSWYMGETLYPQLRQGPPRHPSFFNGSGGPLLRKATALDWAGDPIQVAGASAPATARTSFQEMLDHFRDYTDVVGDNPMNLGATTLGFTAYALTGERSYRDWVLEYVDAWVERTAANGDIVPTSVGLDGRIESATAGTAGSTAGTTPSCRSPGAGRSPTATRSSTAPTTASPTRCCSPATGGTSSPGAHARPGQRQREAGRRPDAVPAHVRPAGQGRAPAAGAASTICPRRARGVVRVPAAAVRAGRARAVPLDARPLGARSAAGDPGVGALPGWGRRVVPRAGAAGGPGAAARKVALLRADTRTPDTTMSDDPNRINPATTNALVQLMLGVPVGRTGYPLHCRLRYFDPRRRARLPEHVGALVERMTEDEVTLRLVNLDPLSARTVVVQGGAYAEHQITTVRPGESDGAAGPRPTTAATAPTRSITHTSPCARPRRGARLAVGMKRYANQPTLAFPWA